MPSFVLHDENEAAGALIFIIRTMSQPSSSPCLPLPQSEPNAQVGDALSPSTQEEREASVGSRPLSRKPDSRKGLQSYHALKRQSQQLPLTPPKSPRGDPEEPKFKKKALSKQEIVEIRDYVRQLQKEEDSKEEEGCPREEEGRAGSQVRSAGTEQVGALRDVEMGKEGNKKSMTQYFHQADIHPLVMSEAVSESDRSLMASLRQKCLSMDESNGLLQKRISWLREEVEMHLERQVTFDRTKQQLEQQLRLSQQQLGQAQSAHFREKSLLQSQLAERDGEITRLKALFVQMHHKFEEEREQLMQQAERTNTDREDEKDRLQERIKQLELSTAAILHQEQQQSIPEEHSRAMVARLLEENKYLRVQNHTLARSREEAQRLHRELKRVANERDSLKKKIIEAAKQNRKHCLDESADSSLFALSELSFR